MERVSDEALDLMIDWNERIQAYQVVDALTELRERRKAENYIPHPACPCANNSD